MRVAINRCGTIGRARRSWRNVAGAHAAAPRCRRHPADARVSDTARLKTFLEWSKNLTRRFLRVVCAFDGSDVDLRSQRTMHRTLVGDFHEPLALPGVEPTGESDRALDSVDHALLGLAVCA